MKRISILGRTIAGAALSVALAAPAGAGTIYAWRTDDGGYAFADDMRRVPEMYKDRVETKQSGDLTGHDRYTPQDDAAVARNALALDSRLDALRKRNQRLAQMLAGTPQAAAGASGVTVRMDSRGQPIIDIPSNAGGGYDAAPVIIEDILAKPDGASNTRTNTVIRRGDDVIAVVRPLHTQSPSFPTESELESGEGF